MAETELQTDHLKAKILVSVARGMSASEAAESHGIKAGQVRTAISRICRFNKLPSEIAKIHANPAPYQKAAEKIMSTPRYGLRKDLRKEMEHCLRLESPDQIEPNYISNLTAAMILDSGITHVGLAEIQEWLTKSGVSLKRKAPEIDEYLTLVKRAAYLLDSFGFDVTSASSQIERLND